MAYAIERFGRGYLQSPYVYVENIEFAKVFSTVQLACEYMDFLDLDDTSHSVVWDESLEPDEWEYEYFEEEIEVPFDLKR